MSAREENYPAPGYKLRIPADLWDEAIAVMGHYGRLRSEGLVYCAGVRAAPDVAVVTGLFALGHAAQGGAVRVQPEEARWLLRTLRDRDEKLLAQLHSHLGAAFHSGGDDAHAASFHPGFLSLVAPNGGHGVSRVSDCAAYEFDGRQFVEIAPEAIDSRIELVPGHVERQPLPSLPQPSWWGRLWSGLSMRLK
jgi:hypothetical protein